MKISTFSLVRDHDETGISGDGVVADGVIFPDGHVAMRWRKNLRVEFQSTVIYESIKAVEAIHGHNGSTTVVATSTTDLTDIFDKWWGDS